MNRVFSSLRKVVSQMGIPVTQGRVPDGLSHADETQTQAQYTPLVSAKLELDALRNQLESSINPGGLLGFSSRMQTIYKLIRKAADHSFPV